jgi:hypothetical protein
MARGDHGLPNVSPAPAIPYPPTPCGRATSETALRPFQGWPSRRAGGQRPSSTPLDTPHRTPRYVSRAEFVDSLARFDSFHDYVNLDAAFNRSLHGRVLPPVPSHCPTPLGVVGRRQPPPTQSLVDLFRRRKFKPDPLRSNCLFAFYAQHFTHQFFKTDSKRGPGFTRAWGHGVDMTHVYGDDLDEQMKARATGRQTKLRNKIND